MREINAADIRMAGLSMTLAQLADFQQQELGRSNGRILPSIKAIEVELWPKLGAGSRGLAAKSET